MVENPTLKAHVFVREFIFYLKIYCVGGGGVGDSVHQSHQLPISLRFE